MRTSFLAPHQWKCVVQYLALGTTSLLVSNLPAADPADSAADPTPAVTAPQIPPPPPPEENRGESEAIQEQFTPTEKIGADSVVSFPVDI